jgi:hypothetical protein
VSRPADIMASLCQFVAGDCQSSPISSVRGGVPVSLGPPCQWGATGVPPQNRCHGVVGELLFLHRALQRGDCLLR